MGTKETHNMKPEIKMNLNGFDFDLQLFGVANVLTTVGKGLVTGRLDATSGVTATLAPYVGFGTGAGTAAVGDTTLITELTTGTDPGYARSTGTGSQITTTVTNDTYQLQATITAGGAIALTEAGNFDAATVGNLMVHSTFNTINLATNDQLTVKLQVQFT